MPWRHGVRVVVLAAVVLTAGSGLRDREGSAAGVPDARRSAAAATCEAPEDPIELSSVGQVESLLVGTWIRCAGDAFAGALVDDVGLEMTADGRFHRVFELADGSLARATGPLQEGEWFVTDNTDINGPGSYQVNWSFVAGGSPGAHARFFESPQTLRLDTDVPTHYRRSTGPAPDTEQPPVTVGECPPLGAEITPGSLASEIVGTWIRCAGEPFAGGGAADVGIEVTADGHFYRVFRLPDGTLARATGVEQEGTWDLAGQLDFHFLGGGIRPTHATFYEPSMLLLDQFPDGVLYERWTGPSPVTGTPPPDTNACGALADAVTLTSVEQVEDLLVGVWINCAGPSFRGLDDGDIGVEIAPDGRWYLLYEADDGSLVRAGGADREGLWSVDAGNAPNYSLVTQVLGGGQGSASVLFLESPSAAMRLDTMIGPSDFLRWTGAAPVPGTPPGPPPPCGQLTDVIEPTSIEQVDEFLIGTWALCAGAPTMFGPAPVVDEVGLELTDDGRYYRLFRQPDGSVARGSGTGLEGTWEAYFTELGKLQIDVQIGGLGVEYVVPTLFGSPVGVRMNAMGFVADYVRGDPAPSPTTTTTTIAEVKSLPPTGHDTTTTLSVVAVLVGVLGLTLVATARTRRGVVDARSCR